MGEEGDPNPSHEIEEEKDEDELHSKGTQEPPHQQANKSRNKRWCHKTHIQMLERFDI